MKLQTVSPIFLKTPLTRMKKLLKPIAKEAYIFGSFPEGSAIRDESDIDLLVIPRKPMGLDEIYKRLDAPFETFLSAGLALHIIMYDPKRHSKDLLQTARKGMRLV